MHDPQDQTCQPDTDAHFRIEVQETESRKVLVLTGTIDLAAAARLQVTAQRLVESTQDVAVDWSNAGYVGAGALQVLLSLEAALGESGRSLGVAGDNPEVRRFLELAGLTRHFSAIGCGQPMKSTAVVLP